MRHPSTGGGFARRRSAVVALLGALVLLVGGPSASASAADSPCPPGPAYNAQTRTCEASPALRCLDGFTLTADGRCIRPATLPCPAGTQLQGIVCVHVASPDCRGGSYDAARRLCYTEVCRFTCSAATTRRCGDARRGSPTASRCSDASGPRPPTCTRGTLVNGRCEMAATAAASRSTMVRRSRARHGSRH